MLHFFTFPKLLCNKKRMFQNQFHTHCRDIFLYLSAKLLLISTRYKRTNTKICPYNMYAIRNKYPSDNFHSFVEDSLILP